MAMKNFCKRMCQIYYHTITRFEIVTLHISAKFLFFEAFMFCIQHFTSTLVVTSHQMNAYLLCLRRKRISALRMVARIHAHMTS